MSISEIAKKRGLVVGTIESHLFKYVLLGDLKITDLISEVKYLELKKAINKIEFKGVSDLKSKVDPKFSYSELQMVIQYLNSKSK